MRKITLIIVCAFLGNFLNAQCTAPGFSVNLSASPDTSWTLSNTTRNGVCCGSSNCVTFTVTTNPTTQLISFNVSNPSPSGSAFYQVNCGTPVSIGTPLCVVGLASPFTITYCKPGGDEPNYTISAGTVVHASDDITIQKTSCSDTLFVSNVQASSITWTSIYPGATGAYNSYLSCLTGCTSTIVTPGANPPPYVDFQVSGNPNVNCGSFTKDTVRVYFVPALSVTISPSSPVICASSGTSVTLTANPAGGSPPYSYTWSNGSHNQSITVSAAGTYTVTVGDKTKCPKVTVVKTIATIPSATFSYTGSPYCKNATNPFPTYAGSGQAGAFSSSPAGLSLNSSTGEINLSASAVGTYTVMNTIAASGSCPGTTATTTVAINPFPTMTSAASAAVCSGQTVSIPLTSSMASTYSWVAADNTSVTGESLTAQTTSTLTNTLTNSSGSAQIVSYTVTPTATVSGGCTGTPQTVNVTVNALDNAGFTYPSSTICQTGTNPSPTITGLAGGIFSSAAGLVFVNSSSGTINLSACTIGSYTVTYTTNGPCPNSATFPINITTAPSAAFSYVSSPFCQNESNPFPTFASGAGGGTFSAAGTGLVFVSNQTGEVDLAASTAGTYTVTNTIAAAGGCATASAISTITITKLKVATFSYTGSPYCQNASNPSPTYSGGGAAGTFTSGSGLSINSGTGLVNLAASTPGSYTVTNTIAATGGCPAVAATATITITSLPAATFSYTGTPFCQNGTNPSPVFSGGGVAGVFNATSVYLNVSSSTGLVDLANSAAGSYSVTNTIAAANGCPSVSYSAPITITALPVGTFSYTASPYCKNGSDPTPVLANGGSNGIYSATPAGLSIDPNAGSVSLSASAAGSYTVTNTIAASSGCPAVIETSPITITPLPVAAFSYTGTPYCQNGTNPSPTYSGGGVGGTFTAPAGLSITTGTGLVNLAASTSGTYTVTNTIAAASGCPAVVATSTITITPLPAATFTYTGTPYCKNGTNPSPTFSGGGVAGTFTSGAGLSINSGTGLINLSASTAGTYTVTNTIAAANGCPAVTATATVTITALPVAAFSYTGTPYCQNGTNPSPTYTGGGIAGTFTAQSGLSINAGSGLVNLSASTPGTYTVTNTISAASGCPAVTATATITITALPTATFNYPGTPYCQSGTNPSPAFTGGGTAGTFTSAAGLSINSGSGSVNLAASTPGTYTVTNTISAASGCPQVVATSTITITALPIATFNYSASPYCKNGTNPSPTFTGGGVAGTFTAPSGLSINSATGLVTLSSSTVGTYTVTNTIAGANGCPPVVATATISITNLPVATFNYAGTPYCQSGTNPSPTFTGGGVAGTFTAPAGLSINSSTGLVNLSASTAGTYTVTNTIAASSGCPPVVATSTITITSLPVATFNYAGTPYCQNGTSPSPTFTGGGIAGTFTSDAGLSINSSSGLVNLVGSTTGTHTVTNTISAGSGCPVVTATTTIAINPVATANAGSDATICSGSTYILSGSVGGGASTFTWSSPAGGSFSNATSGNAVYTPSATDITNGGVTLTLTSNDPAGPCSAVSDVMVLTINHAATANAGNDATICSGTTFTLSGVTGGGASSLTWSSSGTGTFNNAVSAGAIYTPSAADKTSGSVTLTLTTNDPSGPCAAATDAMTLTITPRDNASFSYGSSTFCRTGVDPSPNITGLPGGTFSSSSDSLALNPSTGVITLLGSTLGTYTVTYTTNGPCPDSSKVTVTITNSPSGAFSYSGSPYCSSAINPLPVFPAGSSGGIFSSSSLLVIDTVSGAVNLAASTPGTYTVTNTIAAAGGCASDVSTATISIDQAATVNNNPNQIICYGSNVTLAGIIGGSATSGTWSGGSGTYSPDSTTLGATYSPVQADSIAGIITLILTTNDPAGVCPAVSDQMTLTIQQPATAKAGPAQTICYGSNVTLAGSIGGSAISGTWGGGAGVFNPDANTLTAIYIPAQADSMTGTVTLTLTTDDPSGVCPAVSDQIIITVNQPAIVDASLPQTICYGSDVILAGSFGGSAASGTWSGGTGSFAPDASAPGAIYTPVQTDSAAGTVTLTFTTDDPAGVCPSVSDQMTITIQQPATADANSPQTICYGSDAVLAGSIGGSATSGTWSGGGGSFTPNANAPDATYTPATADSAAGSATLTLTTDDPSGVCPSVSSSMIITIQQPATANANTNQTICYGSNVTLAGTIGGSATAGTWNGGAGTFTPDVNTLGATYTPTSADSTAGVVTLTLTTDDPAGVCPSVSGQMNITIQQPATANAGLPQTICYGSDVTLGGVIGGSAATGTWNGGAGTFSPDVNTLGATYTPTSADSTAGSVTLTLSTDDPAGVCPSVNSTIAITINQPAIVDANLSQTICYGSDVTLAGSIGGSAATGTWSGGAGTFTPDANTPGATYSPATADSIAGTVTLILTTDDPAGVCPSVNDQMIITIQQPATTTSGAPQTICYGSDVTLGGVIGGSATGGTWSGGAGIFSPDVNTLGAKYTPVQADSAAGTVTLTISTDDPAGVCPSVSSTITITISQPAIANAGSSQTICYGSDVTLAGSTGGSATSGLWSGGTGIFIPDATAPGATYSPTTADSTAGSVTLTLTTNDPAGVCPSVSDAMIITVQQPATANAGVSQTICYGSNITLAGTVGGSATSGTWSGGAGTFAPAADSLSAVYTPTSADSTAGSVTLTLTTDDPAGVCPIVISQMVITINQPATVNDNPDQIICYGSTVNLAGVVGGSATTGTWSGGTGGTFSPGANTLNATYTPAAGDSLANAIILTLTTEDPAGVCPAVSDQVNIAISQPVIVSANVDQAICSSSPLSLAGTYSGGASSVTWTTNGSGIFDDTSSVSALYTPSAADIAGGNLSFTITTNDPIGICPAAVDSMKVTIDVAATSSSVTGNDSTICSGVNLAVSGVIGGTAVSSIWSTTGSGTFDDTTALNAIYTPSASDIANGTVTLAITTNDPAGVCNAVSDSLVLTITPRDNASFNYTANSFCQGGADPSPTVTGLAGGVFSASSNLLSINSSTGTINLGASAIGTYTVTYTTNGSCPDSTIAIVTISNSANASFSYSSTSFCTGSVDPAPVFPPGSGAGIFTSAPGLSINSATGVVNLVASTPGVYIVTNSIAANGGCTATSATATISVTTLDSAGFSFSGASYCQADTVQTPAITGVSGGSFSAASGLSINAATGEINVSASTAGTYTVTYTTTGACANSSSAVIAIKSSPVPNAGPDVVLPCGAVSIDLDGSGSGSGAGISYLWASANGGILSGNTTTTPSIDQPGLYVITVSNSNGCSASDSVVVTQGTVTAAFTASPTTGSAPLSVNFTNASVGASAYAWTFGDGNSSTATDPSNVYTSSGTFTAILIATAGNCADTALVKIHVNDNVEIIIPNVFTPNGDGINDQFFVSTVGISTMHGDIFNRWGEKIYSFDGLQSGWDGKTLDKENSSDGTYYLILKCKGYDNKSYDREAYIGLFR